MVEIIVNEPKEIVDRLRNLAENYPSEMCQALALWDEKVLNESAILCPFKTGFLRGSRYAVDPVAIYGRIMTSIGYSTDYAVYVHENLLANHKPPTQAKFLEAPLFQASGTMAEEIIRRVVSMVEEPTG